MLELFDNEILANEILNISNNKNQKKKKLEIKKTASRRGWKHKFCENIKKRKNKKRTNISEMPLNIFSLQIIITPSLSH